MKLDVIVPAKMSQEDVDALQRIADEEQRSRSYIIRRAIAFYLSSRLITETMTQEDVIVQPAAAELQTA